MAQQHPLQACFDLLDRSGAELGIAEHCGNYTLRSDPHVATASQLAAQAAAKAHELGSTEFTMLQEYQRVQLDRMGVSSWEDVS